VQAESKERIVVIDDSEVVLARIRAALATAGYDVVTTSQTVGAARHLRGCQLVIVDYHMPGLDGGTVMKSLRAALPHADSSPLFYLYTTDERVSGTYAALGFDGCLTRKGDLAALVHQVEAVFRKQSLKRLKAK
jgi:two-component system OmpR family response regulator